MTGMFDFNCNINFGVAVINDVNDRAQTLFQYDADFAQKLLQCAQPGLQCRIVRDLFNCFLLRAAVKNFIEIVWWPVECPRNRFQRSRSMAVVTWVTLD